MFQLIDLDDLEAAECFQKLSIFQIESMASISLSGTVLEIDFSTEYIEMTGLRA